MSKREVTLVFIRHTKTGSAAKDEDRRVNEVGMQIATHRRRQLCEMTEGGNFKADRIITSPLPRTGETGSIISPGTEAEVIALVELGIPVGNPLDDALTAEWSSSKRLDARHYLGHSPAMKEYLEGLGKAGWNKIAETIAAEPATTKVVLAVSHGVIASMIVAESRKSWEEIALDHEVSECDGVVMKLLVGDGDVEVLEIEALPKLAA